MRIFHQRVTLIQYRKPHVKNINEELQYLGNSLGLFGERDKDRSCFRVFIELLKSARQNKGMSSDEIAARTKLSRGTVVHHLTKLIESGLVVSHESRYFLRAGTLGASLEEVQKDINRTVEDLKAIAEAIDKELGL
ncbi:MAG TPA: helix-turn-helix domain-containing protein [Candidatus Nanoarchaeia archaeon]|nr:helix-turn-helix domain-containing protein [Candidatus Nanoarchaeia archaeon]